MKNRFARRDRNQLVICSLAGGFSGTTQTRKRAIKGLGGFFVSHARGREAQLRFDMARHFAVFEGRKTSVVELPVKDADVLDLLRAVASPATVPTVGITEDGLVASMSEWQANSAESGGNWLWCCTRTPGQNSFDARALVTAFLTFMTRNDLEHRFQTLPCCRLLTLTVWLAYISYSAKLCAAA